MTDQTFEALCAFLESSTSATSKKVAGILRKLDDIASYADHGKTCKGLTEVPRYCTCGLEALQAELAEMIGGI